MPLPSADLRDATRHATAITSPVVIRRRQNVTVQIRRVQDGDANGVRLKRGGSTGQRGKSAEHSRAASELQKVAARPESVWVRHCGVASAERLTVNVSLLQ
jgi:hypothetical protein